MITIKEKLIKQQKMVIRAFWTTVFFLLGFLFAVWQTFELANQDVLVHVSPAMNLILYVLAVELIIIAVLFISVRKMNKKQNLY